MNKLLHSIGLKPTVYNCLCFIHVNNIIETFENLGK